MYIEYICYFKSAQDDFCYKTGLISSTAFSNIELSRMSVKQNFKVAYY